MINDNYYAIIIMINNYSGYLIMALQRKFELKLLNVAMEKWKALKCKPSAQFDWNVACIRWTDWYENWVVSNHVKSQRYIYRAWFQHRLHWCMYIIYI